MSHKTYKTYSTKITPQSEAIPGKKMIKNNAGGYSFEVTDWKRLQRFLILSSEGGSYYVGERELTRQNAEVVERLLKAGEGKKVVDLIVEISDAGRAAKNDPALFALAMCAGMGDAETRKYALENLPKVARIGTHLFHFADYVQQFRGWGHGLRKAIAEWYTGKEVKDLAFQLVKYQSRDGWSHRDLIKLAHPTAADADANLAFRWAIDKMGTKRIEYVDNPESFTGVFTGNQRLTVDGKTKIRWELDKELFEKELALTENAVPMIYAFEQMKRATSEKEVLALVKKYRMPLEAVPTEKQTKAVLESAIPNLGLTAVIRNLGRYTSLGIYESLGDNTKEIVKRITDMEQLKKARVHPIAILAALVTYKAGHGFKGSLSWSPVSAIVDALDEAFYLSFGIVEPTGKNIMLALDVSGSMTGNPVNGLPFIDAKMASAALAMITTRTEKNWIVTGFSDSATPLEGGYGYWGRNRGGEGIVELDITPRQRLDTVIEKVSRLPFGGTDCSLPMTFALKHQKKIDTFIIITDGESWSGSIHPMQALNQYRKETGIPAKVIFVAMTATNSSLGDPGDSAAMDVVGFDTNAPQIMSDFMMDKI